jgi:hypothetical protein
MPGSKFLQQDKEGEDELFKISSSNTMQRTFCHLFQTLILQFVAIPTGMSRSFLCSVFIAVLLTGLTILPIYLGITPVHAQQSPLAPDENNQGPHGPRLPIPFGQELPSAPSGNFSFGPIASIQNNESGQPAWLAVGFWRGNLLSFNETTLATSTTAENAGGNASSPTSAAIFNANFRMIALNGSQAHSHVITNFRLSNISSNQNGTTTYTGNATISMREEAFADVPTTIKVSGGIISIFPEPSRVHEHYGNTPIYGAIVEEEELRRQHGGPGPVP